MARRAIVTGGNSGIGRATVLALAVAGYDVGWTWHSDEDDDARTHDEVSALGATGHSRRLDLSDPESAPAVVDDLVDALGGVDVLVNNAGRGSDQAFLEQDLSDWRDVLDVDLTGAFLTMQTAARHMVEQGHGGRIVAVTSVHEHVPLKGSSAYCAAKGGLGQLVRVAALELAEHGITVNAIAPGEIATAMTGQEGQDPTGTDRPGIPAGRPGHVREVAHAIRWLASEESTYVTGASYPVDGGMLLMAAQANREL
jgi:NAD(P)-dependent dehydrogenase (short-subunit alcohol dehydrogenase family)